MNFHELVTIEAQRMDPKTSVLYSFKAAPPIDLTILTEEVGDSLGDYLVLFFWKALAGVWDTKAFPDLQKQATEILPVLLMVVNNIRVEIEEGTGDITVEFKEGNQIISGLENYSFTVSTDRSGPSRWEGITPSPSEEFLDLLDKEVLESEAVQLAIKAYVSIKINELIAEEIAKDNNENEGSSSTESNNQKYKDNIVWNMNGLGQLFGPTTQKGMNPQQSGAAWQQKYGEVVNREIPNYGIDLNEIPLRVLEGVLWSLSKTSYRGNAEPTKKEDILSRFKTVDSVDNLPKIFQNISEIPKIQIGKRELLKLAGMNYDNQRDVERAVQSLGYLATTQFCFYYTRLAIGKDKQIERDKNGDYKKESVTAIDTLLDVRIVKDETTQQLKYYEISPSPIFLDQKEKYFMLIPYGWREEVHKLVGNKKASSYLYLFLLYLRYQFEQKRRKNAKASSNTRQRYEIVSNWVTIAQALRMPETLYKRKPGRALEMLDNAYSAAKQLGYLTSYSRSGITDRLVLNPDKYPSPKSEIEEAI